MRWTLDAWKRRLSLAIRIRDLAEAFARNEKLKASLEKARHRNNKLKSDLKKARNLIAKLEADDDQIFSEESTAFAGRQRPNFLIIGAPKCATTWLRDVLAQHPQIFMVQGEIEYFSSHLDRPLDWYAAHFALDRLGMTDSDGRGCLVGEKSPGYCAMSRRRIGLVHRLFPEARLILMIRDPIARHWAHAKYRFSKPQRADLKDEYLWSSPALFNFFRRSRRFGEFSQMIEKWLDFYPSERLLVLRQEEALTRPQEVFERVLRHLGASADYDPNALTLLRERTNVGPVLPMPANVKNFLEEMFAVEREYLGPMLSQDLKAGNQ
jgi:hypothetical protein